MDKACETLHVSINPAGRVVQSRFTSLNERVRRGLPGGVPGADTGLSQAELDSQARDAIKDLFPKIPNRDLHEVVVRAFDKVCR